MIRKLKNFIHLLKAIIANILFGFPSKKLIVIGVTGTDGKTTTATALYHILKNNGEKTALITTIGAFFDSKELKTGLHTTTPDSFLVQKLLHKAAKEKYKYVILETTSHALDQHRNWGINFTISVLTNITHEHLDYHKNYKNYVFAKSRLFKVSQVSIINIDDESYHHILPLIRPYTKIKTYSLQQDADYTYDIRKEISHIAQYNAYNFLAAIATAHELGISINNSVQSLKSFRLPKGRFEVCTYKSKTYIIDFAHTPNSLKNILQYINEEYPKKTIVHVFGCAGERDKDKRPIMGELSSNLATYSIFTEEDFRSENINDIFFDMKRYILEKDLKHIYTIADRSNAFKKAVELCGSDGIILATGKGHEESLARNGTEYPWSDKDELEKAFLQYEKDR